MNDAPLGSDSESEDGAVVDPTDTAASHSISPATEPATPATLADSAAPATPPAPVGPPVPLAPAGIPASTQQPTAGAGAPATPSALATPAAPAAATAGFGTKVTDLARRVGTERALGAALNAAIVYGAAWVLSLVIVILTLIALADSSPDWGWAFEGPGQLVGLSVGGTFTLGATVMSITAKVSFIWLPLLVTALIVVGTAFLARRDERAYPSATRSVRWVRSAITGVAFAALVLLVAGVLPVRYEFGDASGDSFDSLMTGGGSGSTLSFTAFIGAVGFVTVASYLARAHASTSRAARVATPFRLALASVWRTIAVYTAVVSVVLALGVLIYAVVRSGIEPLLTALLWLPTAVVDGLGFVNLAPIGLFGSAFALPGISDTQTSFWMPGELPFWGTALILVVNLAIIVGSGIALALLRPHSRLTTAIRWVTTVASFAVLGVVVSVLGSITVWSSVDTSDVSDSLDSLLGGSSSMIDSLGSVRATVGLAAWTFIIFAVLGALVEAAAVYVAPQLIPLLPASLVARISRYSGTTATATATANPDAKAVPVLDAAGVAIAPEAAAHDTAPAGAVTDPAAPLPEPMSPERKKKVLRILIAIAAAIVLVIGAAVAISLVNSTVYSPKHQVEAYLDNLVDGNASAALEAVDVDAVNDSRVLLTDEVLSAASGGITGYDITDVTVGGDVATVTAELDQDGAKSTVEYFVARDGKTAVLFDNWEMDSVYVGSVSLSLPEGVTDITVNDVEVSVADVDSEYGYVELPAFPGEYVIALGGTNEYLASEPQTVVVTADLEGYADPLSFELAPTEAFTAAVSSQIDELIASCTAQGLIEAEDCPVYTYAYGDITNVAWTINEPATFEILDYGDGEWYVQVEDRGTATVTYTRSTSYSEPTNESDEVDFSVNGTVEMVDGAPVYTYGY
jgi:hypothetical protein